MSTNLTVADIQQGSFEYRANFREPVTAFWQSERQAELIKAVYKALSPWKVPLENVSWNSAAKNVGEIQLNFSAPSLLANIQIGISGVTMTAFNVVWSNAKTLVAFFQAAVDATKGSAQEDFQSQLATLAFHIKPGPWAFKEVLAQFVNAKALGADDANMYGVSVYRNDYSFVIDGSVVIPGGAFVKLIRSFGADKRLEEVAAVILRDEETVLGQLGFKLQ
jgi:hypothetical protein